MFLHCLQSAAHRPCKNDAADSGAAVLLVMPLLMAECRLAMSNNTAVQRSALSGVNKQRCHREGSSLHDIASAVSV